MKSVCSCCQNKKGMTLIETLISLSILVICASIITLYIPFLRNDTVTSRQEIQLFFQQIKDDMDQAYTIEESKNEIIINETNDYIQYVKSGNNIVRKKNGRGHEIVLQNIDSFTVQPMIYGADIHITDNRNVKWSGVLGVRPIFEGGNVQWEKKEQ
ncbi:competence type IV pilus minor pilin ComGF [Salibacterium salarium]|uniref:competence type IV pilus minor pilin ComGF n=1 Tax=Salibacterium salarium TaxID=284579 RepID=UPI0027D8691B|nr:competence type IV pilus minor pilin ComGF [Salibacterium salarium]